MTQLAEVTENTRRGARGLILPAATAPGNPGENTLLPDTVSELKRLGLSPKEVALDGGFHTDPTTRGLRRSHTRTSVHLRPPTARIKTHPATPARYRTGAEGRISHLKRGYGLNRSRLKGEQGQQIWTGWSILAYNADTLAIRTS